MGGSERCAEKAEGRSKAKPASVARQDWSRIIERITAPVVIPESRVRVSDGVNLFSFGRTSIP